MTIKERANKFAIEHFGWNDGAKESANCGYMAGAMEQEQITKKEMIIKASKAYCDVCKIKAECGESKYLHNGVYECNAIKNFKRMLTQ